jgi:Mediator complex subunit 15
MPNQQLGKGTKRVNENEMMEVPNRNLVANSGLQQQAGTAQPVSPFRMLRKEEISKLSPEQQKAYREKQSQNQYQMFLVHTNRALEDLRRVTPKLTPLVMDAPSRARIMKVLTAPATKQMMTRFNVFLYQYFLMTKDSEAVKQLLSYKLHLYPQYKMPSVKAGTWEPEDQFSIGAEYVETSVKDLLTRLSHVMARFGPQQMGTVAAPPTDTPGSYPLSADNLKKHEDMQAAQRAKRPAQEVPPAPTASQPPPPFNDASPRGQGTPRYAPPGLKPVMKQEDLRIPSKRQKKTHQDNAALTPVGGHVTPALSPQVVKAQKLEGLPLKCPVVGCEFRDIGFATKGELERHSNTAHKPVEEYIADPLAFFLESIRDGLGLDENGEAKANPKMETLKALEMQKTLSNSGGGGSSKPPTPGPSGAAMARGVSQASGPKVASPNPSQILGAKGRPGSENIRVAVAPGPQAWDQTNVTLSDLRNTFGDLTNVRPRISLTHYDPLSAGNDVTEFMDEFMESDAWTKMQETAVNIDSASSKATESPAQHSDRGQGSSDISKGDDVFIKIGTEDTELAESWALPELRLEPESGADGMDEADDWLEMDFQDAARTGDVDVAVDMDVEWKEVDWDKLLAEQDNAVGKK